MRRRTGLAMRLDDPQWLRRRYIDEGASMAQMARECATYAEAVKAALIEAGIDIRLMARWRHPQLDDPVFMRHAYLDRGMTIAAIAEELQVDDRRVARALDAAGIPRRPPVAHPPPFPAPELQDQLWLYRAYVVEGRTLRSIGVELGCSTKPVWKALGRYGITR